MLANSNLPFLLKSLWNTTCLCVVLSLWTLTPMFGSIPTREGEGQKHPEQTGEQHEARIPLTNVLSSASSLEFSVFVHLAAHMHNTLVLVWFLQTGSCVCHIHMSCGLCTEEKKMSDSPQTFTLSIFLSLAIKLGWSCKGALKKQLVIKVWAEGIEEQTRCNSLIYLQDNYFAIPFKTPFAFCFLNFLLEYSKMFIWGGLTNNWEKKRKAKQRRKGGIYTLECRIPKNSKEREEGLP